MATEKTEADFEDLNEQQKAFCKEYVFDWNQTRAYMKAYSNDNYQSSAASAAKLLKIPKINEYIEFIQKDLSKLSGVTALRNIAELQKIAYSTIAHLHKTWIERVEFEELTEDQKASIQSIDTKIIKKNIGTKEEPDIVDVEYVKITLYDKQRALDSLNKMLGFNAPEKHQHSGSVEVIDETSRLERIAALRAKLEGK